MALGIVVATSSSYVQTSGRNTRSSEGKHIIPPANNPSSQASLSATPVSAPFTFFAPAADVKDVKQEKDTPAATLISLRELAREYEDFATEFEIAQSMLPYTANELDEKAAACGEKLAKDACDYKQYLKLLMSIATVTDDFEEQLERLYYFSREFEKHITAFNSPALPQDLNEQLQYLIYRKQEIDNFITHFQAQLSTLQNTVVNNIIWFQEICLAHQMSKHLKRALKAGGRDDIRAWFKSWVDAGDAASIETLRVANQQLKRCSEQFQTAESPLRAASPLPMPRR